MKAYYPKGADLKTSKLCAIVNSATYAFDEKYKKDDKMIYFEYKLDSSQSTCVVIFKLLSRTDKPIDSKVIKGLKKQSIAFYSNSST